MRDQGKCRSSGNLLIRADVYNTAGGRTVLTFRQIKTVKREMKRQRMVCFNNTSFEDDGCRLNPGTYSGIYTTAVKEAQYHIMANNRGGGDEVK